MPEAGNAGDEVGTIQASGEWILHALQIRSTVCICKTVAWCGDGDWFLVVDGGCCGHVPWKTGGRERMAATVPSMKDWHSLAVALLRPPYSVQ